MSESYCIELSTRDRDEEAMVALHRTINPHGTQKLYREVDQLLEQGCRRWTINLKALAFTDSHTLGALFRLFLKIKKNSGTVAFEVIENSSICDLIQMTKLDQIFSIRLVDRPPKQKKSTRQTV